jgi:hypothetical protein
MDWKDSILSQRNRVAFWAPFIAIILLVGIEISPFAQGTSSESGNEDSDEDWFMEWGFHDDHSVMEVSSEDRFGQEYEDLFDGETEFISPYDQTPEDDDELAILANDMNEDLSLWFLLLIIIFVFIIVSLIEDLRINKFADGRIIRGAGLGFIALMALLLLLAIPSAVEESFEFAEDDFDDYEGGFWGEASTKMDEGEFEVIAQASWGPAIGFWLLIPFSIICLLGSIANLSYLKEDLEIEDEPVWFKSDSPPEFISKKLPHLGGYLVTATILLAMIAVVSPWYQIGQTWEGETSVFGENETTNSTHEISWALSPFYVGFSNDTGIELGSEGETSFSIDSYSTHHGLENMAPLILSLRWPMICVGLIGFFYLAKKLSTKLDDNMGGTPNGWTVLILIGMIVALQFGTGEFEKEIERVAEDDLDDISPSWLVETYNPYAEDTTYGQAYSVGTIFEENHTTFFAIENTWSMGIGFYAAGAFLWLGLSAMAISFAPQAFKSLNEGDSVFEGRFDKEVWSGRPAIAGMIAILLTASLGAGMGELVIDSESGAPQGLYEWDVNYTRNDGYVTDSAVMSDGESKTWEIDSSEMAKGNATDFVLYISCDEGSQGAVSDNEDSMSWTLTPPAQTDASESTLSGQFGCGGSEMGYSQFYATFSVPEDGTFGETKQEVLSQISWDNMADGIWTLKVIAEVNDGSLPLSNDPDLNMDFEVYLTAYDAFDAEVED